MDNLPLTLKFKFYFKPISTLGFTTKTCPMTEVVMEVDRDESFNVSVETVDSEHGIHEFWESLKHKLDDDLTTEEIQRVFFLIEDKIGVKLIPGEEIQHPSDLLNILENNMLMDDALSTLQHVLTVMDTYPEYGEKSFGQIVTDHMTALKRFGCPNIIGREKEINKVFRQLQKSETTVIWIHGAGGLGKTLLANVVCSSLRSQNFTVEIVNLKHVTNSVELVRVILSKFAVHPTESDLEDLTSQLLYQLGNISKDKSDTYILLDNIENVYQSDREAVLHVLSRCWASVGKIKWIVTSRLPVEMDTETEVELLELLPLRKVDAEKLLRKSCRPIDLSETRCQILLNMAGENPLAIRLLSSALKSLDSVTDSQLTELLKPQLQNAMQDCIQYSYNSLTDHEQYQLHMLSVVETSQFDIETVKAVLGAEEKEAVFLMMKLTNIQIVQRVSGGQMGELQQMSSSNLQYCIHPLIFDYVHNVPVPQEYTVKAQSNFCKYMLQKVEPFIANSDTNYMEAIGKVSKNRPLLKVMINVLSMQQNESMNLFTSDRNIYLSRLQEMLQITYSEKEQLYINLIEQTESGGRKHACLFWKLEKLRMFVDSRRFTAAEDEVSSILNERLLEIADSEFEVYLKGRFWYNKGRLLRFKEEPNEALKCFQISLRFLQNTQYITDATMALDAIGNTYFEKGELDNALLYHTKAADRLRNFMSHKQHHAVAVYEFNVGTVFLAKAHQDLKINSFVTKEASENFEKALKIFQDSIAQDDQLGTNRMPQYASKLSQRAQASFYLNKHKDAIADMNCSLEIKLSQFRAPDINRTMAYFACGKTFLDWHQHLKQNSDLRNVLLEKAKVCFNDAETEMKLSRKACLTGLNEVIFAAYYRRIADSGSVQKMEETAIRKFCSKPFTDSVRSNTSSSSPASSTSSSLAPSSSEQSPSSQAHSHSESSADDDSYHGIPSVQIEKHQAELHRQEVFAQISRSEQSPPSQAHLHSEINVDDDDDRISSVQIEKHPEEQPLQDVFFAQLPGSQSKKRRLSSSEYD